MAGFLNVVMIALAAVLIFGTAIFIHELGHFLVAKAAGIKVNEFALGMGPTLFRVQKGETKYALRLLPIGGFVSMEGEDEESPDPRGFTQASVGKRMAVIVMGALMNIAMGVAILAGLTAFSGSELVATRSIAQFYPNASTQATGLREGDEIIKVNGRRCFTINDISYEFARTQNGVVDLTVLRDGKKVDLPGVTFETKQVTDPDTGESYQTMLVDFVLYGAPKTPWTVAKEAVGKTISYSRTIYLMLADFITGRAALNQLSGPVGIVNEIGKAVSMGGTVVLEFMAMIAINLGVMNMLPFPALDGGKAVLLAVEGIRKKPVPQKFEIALNLIGFALLMLLMLVVTVGDVRKIFF